MRDRAVFNTGVIVALYFEEDASEQAVTAAGKYNPNTLDLAAAESEKVPLLTLDRKMYEKAKGKLNVQMV